MALFAALREDNSPQAIALRFYYLSLEAWTEGEGSEKAREALVLLSRSERETIAALGLTDDVALGFNISWVLEPERMCAELLFEDGDVAVVEVAEVYEAIDDSGEPFEHPDFPCVEFGDVSHVRLVREDGEWKIEDTGRAILADTPEDAVWSLIHLSSPDLPWPGPGRQDQLAVALLTENARSYVDSEDPVQSLAALMGSPLWFGVTVRSETPYIDTARAEVRLSLDENPSVTKTFSLVERAGWWLIDDID